MTHLLAEGGYQSFLLTSNTKLWLYFAMACAIVAIVVALLLVRGVLAADTGTASMQDIAKAIQEGAEAFLSRQFKTIGIIIVPLAVLIFFTATSVTHTAWVCLGGVTYSSVHLGCIPHQVTDLSRSQAGIYRVICFLAGAVCSGLTGFIGMSLAVRGNVRTAAAARDGKMAPALKVAYRTGAITGLLCVGLGLLGATVIVLIFQNTATAVLIGFGFGASLLALFMRVGGGIFTKAADVGADLVGKVEAGIPEDDPRNAATIADNVGDNVGDCAGMAADLFESYVITIIAAIILGVTAFSSISAHPLHPNQVLAGKSVIFPIAIPAIGILATIVGVFVVRAGKKDKNAMAPINRGVWTAAILTIAGTAVVAGAYLHYWKAFYAVLTGVVLMLVASQITEHFTSTERGPVKEVAETARTGPATLTLSGLALGPRVVGVGHHRHRPGHRRVDRPGWRQHRAHAVPGGPDRHRPAVDSRHDRLGGQLRPGVGQRGRRSPRCRASSPARPSGSWSAWTRWATPPRPSPRVWPSVPPSSPRSPCSPRSSRPSASSSRSRRSATRCSTCPRRRSTSRTRRPSSAS